MKKVLALICFSLLSVSYRGQNQPSVTSHAVNKEQAATDKYWIVLKDKNGTPYSLANPLAYLNAASVNRRIIDNIAIDSTDLPVHPSYISQINSITGVNVVYASKWLNSLLVQVTSNTILPSVTSLSFVASASQANQLVHTRSLQKELKQAGTLSSMSFQRSSSTYDYGYSFWQNHLLGVDCMHEKGFRGQGIVIAVLDAGFTNVDNIGAFDTLRAHNNIKGTIDFVSGGSHVYHGSVHGTKVLSCLAACQPGSMIGSSPMASYWLLRTEDESSEKIIEEYNWIRAAEFADSSGADILTSSLIYTDFDDPSQSHPYSVRDGKTVPMSIAATMAARKGIFVLNAAGNDGPGYIGIPADADSICTVGAIDSLGFGASFSSVGPTADGRIKPDLASLGVGVSVISTNGSVTKEMGTSLATPILAGAVACFMQEHPGYSNHKILDSLKRGASAAGNANNKIGWGVPNMCGLKTVGFPENKRMDLGISVFPNPFQSNIHVKSQGSRINEIEIFSTIGQKFYNFTSPGTESAIIISTSEWPSGLFIIRIKMTTGIVTERIIKY